MHFITFFNYNYVHKVKLCQYLFYPVRYSYLILFCCKIKLSSISTLSLKPATNFAKRQSQSALSLQLIGVKLAIACNLFLIIQQLSVMKGQKSQIWCCLHRQKYTFNRNLHLPITFLFYRI